MSNRPTIKDLALAAGVSTATVDRVLNSRTKVRSLTAERVLLAAEEIGYHGSNLLKVRYQESKPRRTVRFLLQRETDPFYRALGKALEQEAASVTHLNLNCEIVFMDEVSPNCIASNLRNCKDVAAVGVVALDHQSVIAEVESLHQKHIPTLALLSDLSTSRYAGYVGWDSQKVGRTAAWTIDKLCRRSGKIAILLGSHRYLGQQLSETSFINYFRERDERFTLIPPVLNLDDDRLAAESTAELLDSHSDIVGIYSAGGGYSGMIQTLRQLRRPNEIIAVCNELTEETRLALRDGYIQMAINTPTIAVARAAISRLTHLISVNTENAPTYDYLNADLYISENI